MLPLPKQTKRCPKTLWGKHRNTWIHRPLWGSLSQRALGGELDMGKMPLNCVVWWQGSFVKNLCLFSHWLFSKNSGTLGSPRLSLSKSKCLVALPVHPSCWSCQKQVTFWDWSNSCPSSPRPFMTTTTWGWGWNADPVLPGTVPVNHLSVKATGQEKNLLQPPIVLLQPFQKNLLRFDSLIL